MKKLVLEKKYIYQFKPIIIGYACVNLSVKTCSAQASSKYCPMPPHSIKAWR